MIGGGSFGKVFRATWRGTAVAVKILRYPPPGGTPAQGKDDPLLRDFRAEVSMLSRLRHPNICLFMGASLLPPTLAIVTELVERGSLWDVLREQWRQGMDAQGAALPPSSSTTPHQQPWAQNPWTWGKILRIAQGIVQGMTYLHGHRPEPVLHRDLKSSNLLCDEGFNIKICDFGLARLKKAANATGTQAHYSTRLQQATMTGNCGTVQWMAPEVLRSERYSETADVYSFGVILWELLARNCPYDGMNQVQVAVSVVQEARRPVLPAWCPSKYRQLVEACWHQDPRQRPGFKDITGVVLTQACQSA